LNGLKKWLKIGMPTLAVLGLAAASPVASADSTGTTGSDQTWTVEAGKLAPSPNGDIDAMAFFPNVIVIDSGDTIKFVGFPHTVDFPGSDGKIPQIGTPSAMAPAGNGTYDGSTYTASGMLMPGMPWTVKFKTPGVYPYYCGMHPGMNGVVIVQDAGTPYPMTAAQYANIGASEAQQDLTAAKAVLSKVAVMTTKNKNGTTVYHVQTDLSEALSHTFSLGHNGSSTISMAKPGLWSIHGTVTGLNAGQTYTPVLNWGKSDSGKSVDSAKFATVTASSNGTAAFSGTVGALAIPQGTWVLDVNDQNNTAAASGIINYPSYADEAFLPNVLKIHVGDTIAWTQFGPNEAHTITFGQPPKQSNPTLPAGGPIYAGSGYFSSGFMFPGKSYQLTFSKAGTYHYICLLHSILNMKGTVVVQPVVKQTVTRKK
jgi:plastocyanin